MKPTIDACPGCGRALPAGSGKCPSCSTSTVAELHRESSEDLSKLYPLESPLFECEPCERLIEVQNHHGRLIVPKYCPWCGGEVLSLIGKELDGYRIDRLLAEGGFGILYLGSNLAEAKMQMVVKFLRPQMGYERPELVRVFVEEARLTEEIGRACWNVVRVHNVRDEPWPYFMEEYIRGTTLQQAINSTRDGRMDLEESKGYLRGMARALAATHEHGRVHRDLKPQNVMVSTGKDSSDNRVKLLDFGLSLRIAGANNTIALKRLSASASGEPDRSPLEVAGTPEYMPPEAFDGMNDFTGDIYSFGVTAYEVLTGQAPWEDPPPGVDRFFYWRDAHKSKAPRSLRDLRPEVPGWLAKVIAKCLEKDKANRIATAQELLHELREPIPFWVKPLSAVAIICVAVLAYFAFVTPPSPFTIERLEHASGEPLDGSTLWVSGVEDLGARRVVAKLPGKTVTTCQASDPRVITDYSKPGAIEISFAQVEDLRSLVERNVAISGAGEMNGESMRLKGELRVRIDPTPPVIASPVSFQDPSSGEPQELRPGLRLRSSVRLSVEVEEDHPSRARLEAERSDLPTEPLRLDGERTKGEGGKVRYTFPLPGEQAAYRMRIVALDHAGNQGPTKPFEITVDDEVELTIRSKAHYLAAGKAFYEIETREELQGFVARSKKDGAALETEVYERPLESGELSSLSLARRLARRELIEVVTPVVSASQYLLAVTPRTEADAPFELHARDQAFPENQLSGPQRRVLLGYAPPKKPAGPEDILEVSVEFDVADLVKLERSMNGGAEFRLPKPRNATTVKKVLISVTANRFQRASCSVYSGLDGPARGNLDTPPGEGGPGPAPLWRGECQEIESTRIVFSTGDLRLEENRETTFLLTLGDALASTQSATLILSTDNRPPRLDVKVTSTQRRAKGYFKVRRWEDLKLQVQPDEPLRWATAFLQGKELMLAASDATRDGPWEFLFRLPGDVKCLDGPYTVRVEATDLAGNSTRPLNVPFVINGEGPVVSLVGPEPLKSDDLVLRITDGNELRYEDARLWVEHWTDEDPSRRPTRDIPLRKPGDGSSDHQVSLKGLGIPVVCHGEIIVRIADALGEPTRPTPWKKPFEMRRNKPRLLEKGVDEYGFVWVLVRDGEHEIYMTQYEVSMGAYNRKGFIENGRYVDQDLVKKIGRDRPRFWGSGESPLPYRKLDDGTIDPGHAYPMVGISRLEAEAFARIFGARLPSWDEWQVAACPTNRLRRYPWREVSKDEGMLCANVKALQLKDSPFAGARRDKWYSGEGAPMSGFYPVEVNFDVSKALAKDLWQKLDFRNELFHMIGNVGEIVLYDKSNATYRVAGGDFNTKYEIVNIHEDNVNPMQDRTPDAYTGFRMVVESENEAFVSKLRSVSP